MNTVSIATVVGGWVVTAETWVVGQLQRYQCPTLELAQRWASLLGAPRRETMATPLRLRGPQRSEEDGLRCTITWVGSPELAAAR